MNHYRSLLTNQTRRIKNCKPDENDIEVVIARTDDDVRRWLNAAMNDAIAERRDRKSVV